MRKYLDRVFGNEEIRTRIGENIVSGTLPHAIVFEGKNGSGRHTIAKELAASLHCEHRADMGFPLPCHQCEACRKVAENLSPDVTVIGCGERATIGVDPVRDIRADMFLSPTESEEKIYIIEDADRLTTQAQNALLVALEEPPEGVYILLLASQADALLTTVRSRVRLYRMSLFSPAEMDRYLSSRSPEACSLKSGNRQKYDALLQGANGCIGKVLDMLDPALGENLMSARKTVDAAIGCVGSAPSFEAVCDAVSGFSVSSRSAWSEELELFLTAIRDLIVRKKSESAPLLYYTNSEEARAIAEKIPLPRLNRLTDGVIHLLDLLDKNANTALLQTEFRDLLKNA